MIRKLYTLLALLCLTSGAYAHWTPQPEVPDWAQRGKLRWALHYSRADRKLVDLFLDANQTMLHGSSFDSPETAQYAAQRGLRYMPYVCSRTITLSEIEKNPQLKGAMVLKQDGTEVLAYNNPQRRYGSLFQPAWPEFVRERTRRQWDKPGTSAIFYDNAFWEVDDHNPATIAAWQKWAAAHGLPPGKDMPSIHNDPLSAAAKAFTAESLTDYHRMLKQFCNSRGLLNSPNIAAATDGMEAVEAGAVDLVFYETATHPPFANNFYLYKTGLAASHGKTTALLAYLPASVGSERGEKTWNEGMHAFFYPSSPVAEEIALAVAEACAVDGTYIPCYNLFPSLPITDLTDPFNQRIHRELKRSYAFQKASESLYASSQPASEIAILYSTLTKLQQPRAQNGEGLSKSLLDAGIPHEVVVASDLPTGLAATKTLIVPNVVFMDSKTATGLRSFIEKGGRAVISGECGAADPTARPLGSDALAGINGTLLLFSRPVQSWTLNGMESDSVAQIKVTGAKGSASIAFEPAGVKATSPAGKYVAYIGMVDESDGTSSFSFSVAGKVVHEGKLDFEDERQHLFKIPPFTAQRGDKLELSITPDAGERGRVQSILIVSADAEQGAALGKGRIVYSPVGLETLPADRLLSLLSPKTRLPQPGKLSINVMDVPAQKLRAVHLVNYDFRYEVEHPGLYASDDGKGELRTYIGKPTSVLRKRIHIEKPSEVVEPVVQLHAFATAQTMADLVITINGKPAARVPASALRASPVEAPFDPALLSTDSVIEVSADGEVDGLQRWIQIGIDADTKAGNSEFSTDGGKTFSAADLSPDLREQTGEYLIRIVDKNPGGVKADLTNLVRNPGFEQVHTPHSETKLTVVPALSVPVQIEGAPQAALAISPEHAPVWLKGQAQGKLTTYTVPQVDIYTVLLLGPSQQALQSAYQAQIAAASWTVPPVTAPLRQLVRSWDKYGEGYTLDQSLARTGKSSIHIGNAAATDIRGASQTVDFDKAARQTYTLSAWSRAENVSGKASPDYSLYVDATCVDGTVYNGHSTPFATGTHDWQQAKLQLAPPAPLKSLRLFLLFRNKTGRVWFDDVQMQATPAP